MAALRAEEDLRKGVPDDRLYDTVLAATGSEDLAARAFADRVAERLRRNETPAV